MKQYILTLCILLTAGMLSVKAQTWGEWFNQKKTKKKYLLKQVAALQVYIEFAKKGYDITSKGLNTVRDIKNGDFMLHDLFFKGLNHVNPKIRNASQVTLIISYYQQIIKGSNLLSRDSKQSTWVTGDEMGYLERVLERLKKDCTELLDEALDLITNTDFEMNDHERINRLNLLLEKMRTNHLFLKDFREETILLIQSREIGDNSIRKTIELVGQN